MPAAALLSLKALLAGRSPGGTDLTRWCCCPGDSDPLGTTGMVLGATGQLNLFGFLEQV